MLQRSSFSPKNVIGLSQGRAVYLWGLKGCEPGVYTNLFLERIYKYYFFHFLIFLSYLCIGVRIEVRVQEVGISNNI